MEVEQRKWWVYRKVNKRQWKDEGINWRNENKDEERWWKDGRK